MSDVVSNTISGVKEFGEGLLSTGKEIAPATVDVVKSPNSIMKTTGIALMGGITGGIVGGILTALPFGMLGRFGGLLKTVTTFSVGAGLLSIGMKKKGSDFGTALIVAGGATALIGIGQIAAMTGFGPLVGLSNFVQRAEGTLKGYETIDSVEVDKSSYQPTQNYGAEGMTDEEMATADTPQVQIATNMESDPMDSVRQEAAMGHGVTQWFGSENYSSSTPLFRKAPSLKAFNASTDVGGNRTSTGDDSMANVIGGTSMADIPSTTTTAYDVSLEMNMTPTPTKEVGGVQDAFDTYILPSYQMPSAGDSGRGVTEWYAESNQTGFIGRFMAGAEGHGAVIGQ